jgi:hypothetical protein
MSEVDHLPMKFIPFQKFTLYTRLSLPDSKQRLREKLDSPKKWLSFRSDSKAYDGEIEGDEFTIFQVSSLNIPKLPNIIGRFSTENGKTAIDACVKLSKLDLRLAACAIGFLVILFGGMLWSSWSNAHDLRSTCLLALFLIGSLLLIYAVTTINILVLAAQSKKFLARLLEAE